MKQKDASMAQNQVFQTLSSGCSQAPASVLLFHCFTLRFGWVEIHKSNICLAAENISQTWADVYPRTQCLELNDSEHEHFYKIHGCSYHVLHG